MSFRRLALVASISVGSALALSGCAGIIIGGAATAGVAAAEERGLEGAVDDAKIRAEINHLWFQRDIEMYRRVTLAISEGRVLLTGSVPEPEARVEAVRLSWQATGVKEVLNEIQVENQSGAISYGRDVVIANTLRGKMLLDSQIRNINYSVDVVNGIIYVMGIAQNQAELDRVIGHARNIENVKKVVNHVRLKDDPRRAS